jgi:tRNA(fMet)-specific endonuclease VapC
VLAKSILDTDILSEYLKGHNPIVAERASRYTEEHHTFSLTSITVYEIVYGLELKGASQQLKRVMAWLRRNDIVTPSADDYVSAATIRATAEKQGTVLELPDCLIGAVAVRLGYTLVTGNTDDFQAIQKTGVDLTLDNWREREAPH